MHPAPETEPVAVREAIGLDGFIEYRHDYRRGSTLWFRHEFSRPCCTIRRVRPDWRMVVGGERRMFSAAEVAAICGFPSAFRFSVEPGKIWSEVGDSVPPPFMRSMARHVRALLPAGDVPADGPRRDQSP